MCDDEPKDARKPPFKANEGLNALAKRSAGRMGRDLSKDEFLLIRSR